LANGSIQVTPTSGQSPYIYNWTGPNGFTASTKDLTNLLAGKYTLLITDNNSCTTTEIIDLSEPGKLSMTVNLSSSIAGGYNINCAGEKNGSIDIIPVNQVKTVSYLWSDGNYGSARINLSAGEYNVIITDSNNCTADSTISITEPDSLKLVFNIIKQPYCPDRPDGEVRLNVSGGVRGTDYSYKWSDNSTGSSITNLSAGIYSVTVTDMNNCSLNDSLIVEALHESCLSIPNAISPNGDLINDVWNIGMVDMYPELVVKIFNRWGELLWTSGKGYPVPWDGRSNGRDLQIDSYHYIIDLHNGSKPIIGTVTIVR
jgi:gliding motility-associated-like protein